MKQKPKIVCLCGSTRFESCFREIILTETLKGNIVLVPSGYRIGDVTHPGHRFAQSIPVDEMKVLFDSVHKAKIEMADEILVVNPDSYIGDSTRSEMEFALRLGKPIRFLDRVSPGHIGSG